MRIPHPRGSNKGPQPPTTTTTRSQNPVEGRVPGELLAEVPVQRAAAALHRQRHQAAARQGVRVSVFHQAQHLGSTRSHAKNESCWTAVETISGFGVGEVFWIQIVATLGMACQTSNFVFFAAPPNQSLVTWAVETISDIGFGLLAPNPAQSPSDMSVEPIAAFGYFPKRELAETL